MSRASSTKPATQRDVRLDFFRGIGMFIIFIAHVPGNTWSQWIPARFGFSDATEIFVFCSGMASAIAFASVFDKQGFAIGCARIAHRCWQVYWAHLGLFFAAAAMLSAADILLDTGTSNIGSLNLSRFIGEETARCLVGLFTLTYVPNLFDILPMYLVILFLVPVVMGLSRFSPILSLVFCFGLWLIATNGHLLLPAEPWSNRKWYFDPLAWQLVFFTGFAFIRGWLPAPPVDRRLIWASSVVLFVSMVYALPSLRALLPQSLANIPRGLTDKSQFGVLRYVHFLALAYLVYISAGPRGARLSGAFVDMCCRVGQQALAVFIAGILLALLGGVILRQVGYSTLSLAVINITGMALLIVVAYVVGWFKRTPWRPHIRQVSPPQHEARPASVSAVTNVLDDTKIATAYNMRK